MAKVLDGYEFDKRTSPFAKYPWSEWTDGRVWSVTEGVDISQPARNFSAGTLTATASRYGMKVRRRVQGNTVIFQFYKPEGATQ